MKSIRVLIFDDNRDRLDSLGMLVMSTPDLEMVGAFNDCREAVKVTLQAKPDVILMDIEMPGVNGITATNLIKQEIPSVNVLIQTVFEDPDKIFDSIVAGASGYILKSSSAEKVIEAIREVHAGGSSLSPNVAAKVLAFFKPEISTTHNLSERESDVLNLLVKGLSYKLIADKLMISYHTVNTHIRKIYEKLQVHSAGEAIAKAIREKLVR